MTIYNLSEPPSIKKLSLRRRHCRMTTLTQMHLKHAREMIVMSGCSPPTISKDWCEGAIFKDNANYDALFLQ